MTDRIGRYDLVKTLALGDRGKLYLARTTGYGGFARHVVIKTFEQLPGAAEGPFLEETLDLGRLHHQHITPVLDVGRDGELFFVALDFLHGRSAREVWLRTFTLGALLPLDFAFTVVAAIASGLHHAHTRRRSDGTPLGLVHGHVSLSNVLIGFDGAVQLIGFAGASARHLRASETQLGFSKDQLAYLAPEQARRQGVDARSDVFALGVILYELTTMRRAFRDDSDRLTIERVKLGSYVKPRSINPDFPPELERIITRALHIDPDARYPNAEMFRRELVAVGHRLELVLGDTAIIEVMNQLFEDSAVDPWASGYAADNAPDEVTTPDGSSERRRPLRAATETVDALAIELEISVENVRSDTDQRGDTNPRNDTDPASIDTRTTTPVAALSTGPTPRVVPNDTDGVPVLMPLPARALTPDVVPVKAAAAPPLPRRRRVVSFQMILIIGVIATVAITTALALALRGSGGDKPRDAASAVVPDAPLAAVIDAPVAAAIDAAAIDASTTVRLQITSTPSNATLILDGKRLGKTPFDGVVDRADGIHVLKLRMSRYVTGKLDIELTGDVTQDLVLERSASTDTGTSNDRRPSAPD